MEAQATVDIKQLLDVKESTLAAFDKFTLSQWAAYKVNPAVLNYEIQSWRWRTVWVGRQLKPYLENFGIGESTNMFINRRRQRIVDALTLDELKKADFKARQAVEDSLHYMWAKGWIDGPDSSERLVSQANKAESLAKYLDKLGKDEYAEKQRAKAKILRRKAAGEDVEVPKRAAGAIDRVRAIYSQLESDGKPHIRKEYIDAGIAAGIHPGTCAVQYAKWKKEHR